MIRLALLLIASLGSSLNCTHAEGAPHWAFQKPRLISPPKVRATAWVRTPVDSFLLDRLEKEGLTPAPEADRGTLLRRVCFTLTGLPPTPEQRRTFLSDDRPDAYERLVESILASPHYGERWAQHWLDVVRFAETNGYEGDAARPHAWRYRDWVIHSFNQDRPYDAFLTEQLAGDLLASSAEGERRKDLLIAAGLHRCGPVHMVGGNVDAEELRQEFLTEITDGLGSAFLGLTVGCARCHDHKFDPFTQKDYYQIEAFFSSMHPKEVPIATSEEREHYAKRVSELNGKMAPLRTQIAAIEAPYRVRLSDQKKIRLDAEYRAALAVDPRKRTPEEHRLAANAQILLKVTWDEVVAALSAEDATRRSGLRKQVQDLQALIPPPPAHAWTLELGKSTPTHILKRGSIKRKGELVQPGVPSVLAQVCPQEAPADKLDRLALARWLTRPAHPLTSRVIVNRVWQYHFGRGLVGTPSDFGTRGESPSHRDLLDWLSRDLVNNQWSIKQLQRRIVLSSAFRQDSKHRDSAAEIKDPDNRLLWRGNRIRLDAETLRDSVLAVTGNLTRALGGPSVRVPLEPEVYDLIFTEDEPDGLWPVTPDQREHSRRTTYLFRKRNVRLPLLEAFDLPDTLFPCARRSVSTFAPQALILLNGPFMQGQSRLLAENLLQQNLGGTRDNLAGAAIERVLGRKARKAELTAAVAFLGQQSEMLQSKGRSKERAFQAALADLCLTLLNRNEFVYVR